MRCRLIDMQRTGERGQKWEREDRTGRERTERGERTETGERGQNGGRGQKRERDDINGRERTEPGEREQNRGRGQKREREDKTERERTERGERTETGERGCCPLSFLSEASLNIVCNGRASSPFPSLLVSISIALPLFVSLNHLSIYLFPRFNSILMIIGMASFVTCFEFRKRLLSSALSLSCRTIREKPSTGPPKDCGAMGLRWNLRSRVVGITVDYWDLRGYGGSITFLQNNPREAYSA